jgi:2-keto-4-pentenoate hydratase/2-oxohepta-3-ene-1,7-dioic acid hydratase in catechol pathway
MVVGIREQIALCSSVTRLEPGDIIASGTMAGVGKLTPGDEIAIEISRVGRMELRVAVPAPAV